MMKLTCKFQTKIERWFDGEFADADGLLAEHLTACGDCARYHAFLGRTRTAVQASTTPGTIADTQFPAFWAGVELGAQTTRARSPRRGLWAAVSLASAALVSAVAIGSIYLSVGGGPESVAAESEFLQFSTDLPGATTTLSETDGTPTLMVQMGNYDYAGDGDL